MIQFLRKWSTALILFGIFATVVGLASACYLPILWRQAAALAKDPQRITLHDLAAKGPGDNPHVLVTDFICGRGYVFQIETRKGAPPPTPDQTSYGRAWIPLFPKSSPDNVDEGEPTSFVVLLETSKTVASVTGFHLLSRRESMEGLVAPLSERGLSPEVRKKLEESYPDTNFGKCLILEQYEGHEKEDAQMFAPLLAISTGVGLLVGLPALALGFILGRSKRKQTGSSKKRRRTSPVVQEDEEDADGPRD